MNKAQLNTLYKLERLAARYGDTWSNGVSVDISVSSLGDSPFIWVNIHPTYAKWYEGRMSICGVLGKRGGFTLSKHTEASKDEIYLFADKKVA